MAFNMTQTTPSHSQAVELARRFHDAYERLAPQFGYITREDTRAFDPESSNGKLMTAVCAELTSQQEVAAPVGEFDDWPDFNEQAMGCGLEDRNITDRYEAMRYGWDEAMERVGERFEQFLAAGRVPVASLASREQGVEVVRAEPVTEEDAIALFRKHNLFLYPMRPSQLVAVLNDFLSNRTAPAGTVPLSQGNLDQGHLAVADSGGVQGVEPADEIYEDPLCDCGQSQYVAHSCAYQNGHDIYAKASQPKAPAPVPVVQGEVVDLEWQRLPEIRGKFLDYAKEPTDANALRIIRACADRFTPANMAVGAVGGVGAVIGYLYDWVHSSALGKPDEHFTGFTTDKAHAEKHDNSRAVCLATPAPEQATLDRPVAQGVDTDNRPLWTAIGEYTEAFRGFMHERSGVAETKRWMAAQKAMIALIGERLPDDWIATPAPGVTDAVEFCWCIESENSADWCFAADREGVLYNARFLDPSCIRSEPFQLFRFPSAILSTASPAGEVKS